MGVLSVAIVASRSRWSLKIDVMLALRIRIVLRLPLAVGVPSTFRFQLRIRILITRFVPSGLTKSPFGTGISPTVALGMLTPSFHVPFRRRQ